MKKLKLTTVILLMAAMAYGQGVAINEDGAAPDPSAMLEVTSTEKGILIPRMTQAERDAIAEPATGLLIFQTDATEGFYFNAGNTGAPNWQRLGEGGAGQWSQSGDNIYYLQGNVGIGEPSPQGKLHVSVPGEWAGIVFSGTGLNDLEVDNSGYNGSGPTQYAVRIQNSGPTPNLIETSSNGGKSWSAPFPIAPNIDMGFGVIINFGSTSGYTWNDRWDWTVNESFYDVLVVKDDKVGIGTSIPTALLHTSGDGTGEGNVLFSGLYKTTNQGDPPAEGAGTRMMWYPDKAAFRAGRVSGTVWNKDNIGNYSLATGYNTRASGAYSTALGAFTDAPSGYETVIGRFNTTYEPASATGWNNNDRLFVVGNGTTAFNLKDAMVIMKNGNTGIGTSSPAAQLHTTGSVRFEGAGTPGEGRVLTSDVSGNATWQEAAVTYQIGDFAHGGVVFYVEACGTKGLVCAIEDQDGGSGVKWWGGSTEYNTMARGDGIYAGKMNTSIIIAVHTSKNDFDDHAALVCANYTGGGFGDWYLPSKEELNQMYINRVAINNTATVNGGTGFASGYYWSSSEYSSSHAWGQNFGNGHQAISNKTYGDPVRAVRAF